MTPAPQRGDVIIRKHPAGSVTRFILSIRDGQEQLSTDTYEAALTNATTFARQTKVDVWYTEDGQSYRSVAGHRVRTRSVEPT